MEPNLPFHFIPNGTTTAAHEEVKGTRRALLIGINYVNHKEVGELYGCQSDIRKMKEYITTVQGFQEENITILTDDGEHDLPTKENIMNGIHKLVKESKAGDSVFFQHSGKCVCGTKQVLHRAVLPCAALRCTRLIIRNGWPKIYSSFSIL